MPLEEEKNPASLEDTLNNAPQDTGLQFTNMRNTMDKLTRAAYNQAPSVSETLNSFMSQVGGKGVVSPTVAGGVLGQETQRRTQSISDIYRNTLRTINTMETIKKEQQANVNNLMGNLATAGLLGELTGAEFDIIQKTGVLPMETLQKISTIVSERQKIGEQPSISDQLKAREAGYDIEDGMLVEPQQRSDSLLGGLTVTGYGSDLWNNGLDVVLDGGQMAPVKTPFAGEVVFAGDNGGFGNQVRIRLTPLDEAGQPISTAEAEEVWFSHLGSINVKQGDIVNENTILGTQGNTGSVLGGRGEQLTPEQIQQGRGTHLDVTMLKPDGSYYTPQEVSQKIGISAQPSGKQDQLTLDTLTTQLGKMVYGTRISDKEGERIQNIIKGNLAQNPNMTQGELRQSIMTSLLGFDISPENYDIGNNLASAVLQFEEEGMAGYDMVGLSRLIESGNYVGAMTKVENSAMRKAKEIDPDGYLGEAGARAMINLVNDLTGYIRQLDVNKNPIGNFQGTFEDWLGRFKGEEATKIKSQITALVADWRLKYAGANVTETEMKFLEGIVPKLGDSAPNFRIKFDSLVNQAMAKYNASRTMVGLPEINREMVLDKELRSMLYKMSPDQINELSQ